MPHLEAQFGRYGHRLFELACGVDHSPVVSNRLVKSISSEDTFAADIPLSETEPAIRKLADKTWTASRREQREARTVVLKLNTAEFETFSRSYTPLVPPSSCEELTAIALSLRERVQRSPAQLYRLVGAGLSNFQPGGTTPPLFAD